MRFRLQLEVNKKAFGNILPINYQYEQSAAIYKILSRADAEYAAWLHENGFMLENGKRFKLFTFSRFKIEHRRLIKGTDRLQINSDMIEWQISFLPEKSTQNFIQSVFMNQIFEIGDRKSVVRFTVRNIEVMPNPDYKDEMTFRTMSPICLKSVDQNKKVKYLSLADENAKFILLNGLKDRYLSYFGKPISFIEEDCVLKVLDLPVSELITIKAHTKEETKIRGFSCTFRLQAPKELLELMYESGAGSLCAQGFGCLRVVE